MDKKLSRRRAFEKFWMLLAASPLAAGRELYGQAPPSAGQRPHLPERIPPLAEIVNAFELEGAARKKLPQPVYDHIAAGAGSERTVRRNREFFDRITFRPRVLVNVTELNISTELFGQTMFAPILAGPTSNHGRAHPEAEFATVTGAAAAKTAVIVSHRSSQPLDQILARAKEPTWFQIDVHADASITESRIKHAVDSGCKVVCLTVGNPYRSVPARDIHNQYRTSSAGAASEENRAWPPHPDRLVAQWNPRMSWEVLDQVKRWAGVPVLLKGILSAEEAGTAVERGVDGVVVSNHGGRASDGVPSTIERLPKIAEAVGARTPIFIDGGFRRGTDILKALALGADGILLGRPVLWALAAYGADGVQKLFEMLQHELALAMGLSGQPNLAAVGRSLVKIHSR